MHAFDHYVSAPNDRISIQQNELDAWADEQFLEHVFPTSTGISYNDMVEAGHSLHGTLVLGADSHPVTNGALGAFATGIDHTDLGDVLRTSELQLCVTDSQRVNIDDRLPDVASAMDLALALRGEFTTTAPSTTPSTSTAWALSPRCPRMSDALGHHR